MKVNFDQVLSGLDGEPIKQDDKELTLGMVCEVALATPLRGDEELGPDKMVTRWRFLKKLHEGGEQEITPEEATEIRSRVSKTHVLVVAGQAIEALSG